MSGIKIKYLFQLLKHSNILCFGVSASYALKFLFNKKSNQGLLWFFIGAFSSFWIEIVVLIVSFTPLDLPRLR